MVRSLHVRHIRALFISERRLNMSEKRRDNKGRILRTGESQRKNGMYEFRYTDANKMIIPGLFEPPVRILRATVPENGSQS